MVNQETANAMLERTANHFYFREFRHRRGIGRARVSGVALAWTL